MLAGRDELLRQQRAHPGRAFDGPRARRERGRPGQQPFSLLTVSNDTDRVDHRFGVVDRGGGVGPLVRVDADHEHGLLQCWRSGFATVGTPDVGLVPFLLRATPRLDLTG